MSSESTKESTRTTWRTIDYIGGGFVLQVKMTATVKKTYRRNYRKKEMDFKSAEVIEAENCFEADVDIREWSSGDKGHINSIHQPHRIVHLSDLEGVEMAELLQDVEERGGLK